MCEKERNKMDKINLLEGVVLTPLKQIFHPQGDVFHAMKKSDPGYLSFGEAYFSTIKNGEIKSWKKHLKMTLNLVVPIGEIKFVIYDDRPYSKTKNSFYVVNLSSNNYQRLTIPPCLWTAFKGIGENTNLLLNIADLEHDPAEIERKTIDAINYNW